MSAMADLSFLESLAGVMMDASFCPLSRTVLVPFMSLLKNFRPELEANP